MQVYKKIFIFNLISLLSFLCVYSQEADSCEKYKTLLFIDTYANEQYSYNNFFELMQNTGYKPEYINYYELKNKDIIKYDAVVFLVSTKFMNSETSFIFDDVIDEITKFIESKNKTICFLFPDTVAQPSQTEKAKQIIKDTNALTSFARRTFKPWINYFLKYNLQKNRFYKTALYPKPEPKKEIVEKNEDLEFYYCADSQADLLLASLLPLNNKYCDIIKRLFPFGLYIKDFRHNNNVFLFKSPTMLFNESEEDYRINPISQNLQNKLEKVLQEVFIEIKMISEKTGIEDIIKNQHNFELPEKLTLNFYNEQKKLAQNIRNKTTDHNQYKWCKNGIWAGWIDLEAYDGGMLEIAIENIATANLNLLWIRFDPENYLSKNGISEKNKDLYFERINRFTKALKQKYQDLEKDLPKIFIGTELTGNFKTIHNFDSMKDIYNNNYTKIPSPFDIENFWKTEFFNSFEEFVKIWNNSVGNGIEIGGVFFDFEMYHAQNQESSYPSLCDFSDSSWNLYKKHLTPEETTNLQNLSRDQRIKYLYKNDKLKDYFCVLQKEACLLGEKIGQYIKEKLPNALIGAYMPAIPSSWFYLGILSGLSTKQEPIILATFNNNFFTHYQWLVANNIHCLHISVILLSKLKTENDFGIINNIRQKHDGVWFNRFSRLGHQHEDGKWWSVESTPLDYKLVVKKIGTIVNK